MIVVRLSSVRLFVRNGCIVVKQCEIWPRLLLNTNRKSHIGFQMTWKSLTLDDLEGHWQPVRSVHLAAAGLFVDTNYTVKNFLESWIILCLFVTDIFNGNTSYVVDTCTAGSSVCLWNSSINQALAVDAVVLSRRRTLTVDLCGWRCTQRQMPLCPLDLLSSTIHSRA